MSRARFVRTMRLSRAIRHLALTLSISASALAEAIRILHL